MAAIHTLSDATLRELADSHGGVPAIEALAQARLSRHLLLLRALVQAWPGTTDERDEAVALVARAQQHAPDPVAALLGYPMVGAWAAATLRRLSETGPDDTGHLYALAVAAAVLAGLDVDAEVPARDGTVVLPSIGLVHGRAGGTGRVRVRARAGVLDVPVREIRRLTASSNGQSISVALDDVDPYRHGHHAPAQERLPDAEVTDWRELFAQAWELLAGELPERAAEIAAGLRSLVPLACTEPGAARSATLRDAFGVFGLTRPASAADFAVTLVHEFQHSKLSAVLDIVRLYDPADRRSYFAPWRTDPRPLGGLLQGVYAFVGVADTWRALAGRPALHDRAVREFAQAREQVDLALGTLAGATALTPAGQAFVGRLRTAADALLAVPVPPAVVREARLALEHNRQDWQQRNGIPTPA